MDQNSPPSLWKLVGFLAGVGIMMYGDFWSGMAALTIMQSGDIARSIGKAWQQGVMEARRAEID